MVIKNTERSSILCISPTFYRAFSNRWLRTFNVTTASHVRQRLVANEWSGDDLVVELAPFQSEIPDKTGHYEIRSAPWGYIDDLSKNIMRRLDNLERCVLLLKF